MDDESYFSLSYEHYSNYYYTDGSEVDRSVRTRGKKKFEKKVMVWLAISANGRSEPFYHVTQGSVNGEVYANEIITKFLHPFIENKHSGDNVPFWPDLATAHYSRVSTNMLQNLHIPFVPKELNPPCVPQARPIEKFWQHWKYKLYEDGWGARSIPELIERMNEKLQEFDHSYFSNLMRSVRSKIRKAVRFYFNTLFLRQWDSNR